MDFLEIKFYLNENFEWHYMEIEFNSRFVILFKNIKWNSNSIEEKWNANWCRRYWKSIHGYGVGKKKNFQNTKIQKDKHLSIPLYLGIGFTNSILELSKDNLKFSYLNQFLWIIVNKINLKYPIYMCHMYICNWI
jgi:hypothetical protein